jgi:GH25 family lysozyme M1 (1,4-beta-N-acetylmuramidase)
MPIFGVDVSRHQGSKLDWAKIRGSGIEFMIARASLATTPDERYRDNHRGAKAAGIPVLGAYHFLYPANVVSPAEQARLFLKRIGDPAGLLTMLDIERDNGHKPRIEDVRAFAATFRDLTSGHPLLLYAPAWYWPRIQNPAASDLGPLVASRYVPVDLNAMGKGIKMRPAVAFGRVQKRWWRARHGGWTRATILQFSSHGLVNGYRRRIDLNAFRGTTAELAELARTGASPIAPDEPDDGTPDDGAQDEIATDGLARGESSTPSDRGDEEEPRFHTVVAGDTLFAIALRFGWEPEDGRPAYRVMLAAFPENQPFRANPKLIRPGDRVRVR